MSRLNQSGYLRCGECDSNMVMKKGANHIYYYCNSYLKDKKCCVKSIQKEYLEKLVIQILNNFRSVINEMDEQITNITNLKKVNYDFDILKFKIRKKYKLYTLTGRICCFRIDIIYIFR